MIIKIIIRKPDGFFGFHAPLWGEGIDRVMGINNRAEVPPGPIMNN